MSWDPESASPVVGSFMPMLRWAVEHTTGPVLELGGGYFSSPYVHEVCCSGRQVYTYEYDLVWADQIRARFVQPVVTDFADIPTLAWSIVLVDCEGWNRLSFLEALRPRTQVFIVHDSQDPWVPETVLDSFAYRQDFDLDPRTTLVSDALDVRVAHVA